jgi:hypothetical protein
MCGKESRHYKLAVTRYGQAQKEGNISEKKNLLEEALSGLDKAFTGVEQDDDYKTFRNAINSELAQLNN